MSVCVRYLEGAVIDDAATEGCCNKAPEAAVTVDPSATPPGEEVTNALAGRAKALGGRPLAPSPCPCPSCTPPVGSYMNSMHMAEYSRAPRGKRGGREEGGGREGEGRGGGRGREKGGGEGKGLESGWRG